MYFRPYHHCLKNVTLYCLLCLLAQTAFSQYYLRGEVKDEKSHNLANVRIFVHSAKAIYYTGPSGSFGITINSLYDSVTFSLNGYQALTVKVKTDTWQTVTLKMLAADINSSSAKLISITKDLRQTSRLSWKVSNETYFQLVENEFVKAAGYPNTSFSLSVNKASYSNVRRFINSGSQVPPDAVKAEEMVNYFNLHYREPAPGDVFRLESKLTSCPWDAESQLLFLNVSAKKLDLSQIPPSNFVFLIDVSGSMDMPNRLPLLKAAFQLFVKNLRDKDMVSIVMYGGTVGIWLPPTPGSEKDKIAQSIEELTAAGDTPGESAILAAYKIAESSFIKGGNNRVILATDGDFNVGQTSEKALDELITKQRQTGIYLTCLGVGMGNLKDSKLQVLAKKGNGNYAYLDDIQEAEKVLVKELTQTLYAVANEVSMNVSFNTSMVKEYRLIGFDNRKEAVANPSNDLEGGEIGSGSSTLAIFQILPTQQNLLTKNTSLTDDLGSIKLRYKTVNDTASCMLNYALRCNYQPLDSADKALKFSAAVSMFALKLKQSSYGDKIDWPLIKSTATTSAESGNFLQQEFLTQVSKAQKIYEPVKRKKKKKDDEDRR